jgi:hypothetical protein
MPGSPLFILFKTGCISDFKRIRGLAAPNKVLTHQHSICVKARRSCSGQKAWKDCCRNNCQKNLWRCPSRTTMRPWIPPRCACAGQKAKPAMTCARHQGRKGLNLAELFDQSGIVVKELLHGCLGGGIAAFNHNAAIRLGLQGKFCIAAHSKAAHVRCSASDRVWNYPARPEWQPCWRCPCC